MRRPPGNKEACNPGDARWDNVPPMLRSTATVLTVLPLRHSGASLQVVLFLWQTEPSVLCRDVNAEHCTLSPGHKQCHQAPVQCYIHQWCHQRTTLVLDPTKAPNETGSLSPFPPRLPQICCPPQQCKASPLRTLPYDKDKRSRTLSSIYCFGCSEWRGIVLICPHDLPV